MRDTMESIRRDLEEIYKRKIALFTELRDCIALERENLINMDIKNLWAVMEEKHRVLESLEEAKDQLTGIIGDDLPYPHIPPEDRPAVMELCQTLSDLREDIKARVRENVLFVKETLDFFHEMASMLAMGGRSEDSYGPLRVGRKGMPNLIYHHEV